MMTDDEIMIAKTNLSAKRRLMDFVDQWSAMNQGDSADFRLGRTILGKAAIMISIGQSDHLFDDEEAAFLVEIIGKTIDQRNLPEGSDFHIMKEAIEIAIAAAKEKISNEVG